MLISPICCTVDVEALNGVSWRGAKGPCTAGVLVEGFPGKSDARRGLGHPPESTLINSALATVRQKGSAKVLCTT